MGQGWHPVIAMEGSDRPRSCRGQARDYDGRHGEAVVFTVVLTPAQAETARLMLAAGASNCRTASFVGVSETTVYKLRLAGAYDLPPNVPRHKWKDTP